ncbi:MULTISPECIES: methyl-accepting chemotaxis protein [unclassified Thalassolituus]|uniref:methyl-accepting chemotaxis protein n=1 Tax=unclassified Thalassolituus TaxID=2624967 RepID=UPI0025FBAAAA|nr:MULTISPECIES: methyl-accepting chemotaxis protein [unclassified Thalassolituus]
MAVPLLLVVFLESGLQIRALSNINGLTSVQTLVEVSSVNSLLAHELQKERGMSAGFLGSKGQSFGDKLPGQRQLTNGRIKEWQALLASHPALKNYPELYRALKDVQQKVAAINALRERVDAQSVALPEVLAFYTGTIDRLLVVPALATAYTSDGQIVRALQAYYSFLQGKERAGIERAVMSNVFGRDSFTAALFTRFVRLVSEQDAHLQSFERFADSSAVKAYQAFRSSQAEIDVQSMRDVALSRNEGFNVESAYWFERATARINGLKELENGLEANLISLTAAKLEETQLEAWSTGLFSLLAVALTLLLVWLLSSAMYRQIIALQQGLHLAGRNLQLNHRFSVLQNDELGDAARAGNEMLEQIESTVKTILDISAQLTLISMQNHMTIKLSSKGMNLQQEETGKVVTAMSQQEIATQEISASMQQVAENTESANEVAASSGRSVEQSVSVILQLDDKMKQVSDVIRDLHSSSDAIGGVLSVIKNIAEQTNLLALNAAIEAARAGEQGRGFAVVADEVRTLAQRTQESTAEIESIVSRFQSESKRAFEAVESSQSTVKETVNLSSGLTEELHKIESAVSLIRDMTDQVAAAAEEHVSTNREMSGSMRSIYKIADHTVATSSFMSKTAQEQSELANKLRDISARFVIGQADGRQNR